MIRQIGTTVDEVMREWKSFPPPGGTSIVVGWMIPGGYYRWDYHWAGPVLRHTERPDNPHRRLIVLDKVTVSEYREIEKGIERGWFQIQAMNLCPIFNPQHCDGSELETYIYHHATGFSLTKGEQSCKNK